MLTLTGTVRMTDHMVGLPWVSGGSSVHFHSGCTSCHLTPGVALVGRAFVLSLWLGESSLTRGGGITMEFPFAFPSSYWMLNIFFYALIGHLRLFWKLFVSLCSFIGWIIIWGRIILSSLCVLNYQSPVEQMNSWGRFHSVLWVVFSSL